MHKRDGFLNVPCVTNTWNLQLQESRGLWPPRQAPLSSRALSSKLSSVPFKGKRSHHSIPECYLRSFRLFLSLLPPQGHVQFYFCQSINRLVGMIWNRKFAPKQKRALAVCISASLQTEFFVLKNQIKAKLSVILFYPGGISPLRSTIACWMCGSGTPPAPLHSSCPNSCPSETGRPTVMATWLMFACEDGTSQAKQGQFLYFAKQKRLQVYNPC